jgi:hypothetical protein
MDDGAISSEGSGSEFFVLDNGFTFGCVNLRFMWGGLVGEIWELDRETQIFKIEIVLG